MTIEISELGFTEKELQERVVDGICERLMCKESSDGEGYLWGSNSDFKKELDKQISTGIESCITQLAEQHVLPNVATYIEELTLQATNKWGEKKGDPISFVEYLVGRANEYMYEKVDYNGRGKGESDYHWSGHETRITHLIHSHLQHEIESAMKQILRDANTTLVEGIKKTVELKLGEIVKSLKVSAG